MKSKSSKNPKVVGSDNLSPVIPKRFSAMIREINYNTYRAYKMSNDPKPKSRNTKDILNNNYNPMKAPFGLKSKRFQWQSENSQGCLSLTGTFKHYSTNNSTTWRDMMNRTQETKRSRNIGDTKAFNYSIAADINSKRTLTPLRDIIPDGSYHSNYKKKLLRSSSTGSIANLLRRTPGYTTPRVRDRITKESGNIFSTDYNTVVIKRHKSKVNMNELKNDKSFAGNCKIERSLSEFLFEKPDESKNIMNIARRRKLNSNTSDIFNLKKPVNRQQEFIFTYNESQM